MRVSQMWVNGTMKREERMTASRAPIEVFAHAREALFSPDEELSLARALESTGPAQRFL